MKQGRTLVALASELDRQRQSKRDFIAATPSLSVRTDDKGTSTLLMSALDAEFAMNLHANRQVEHRLQVPAKYGERLRTNYPDLYDGTINYLFRHEPQKRLIRTLDGTARAFLSDRYRVIDNEDLADVVLPILAEVPEMEIVSCEVTETRMYIKALFPRIQEEIKLRDRNTGDIVQSGVVISNSEIGLGSVRVEPLVYILICKNGMIASSAMKRHHVGRAIELFDGSDASEVFKDDTKEADDRALMLKVRDVVNASTSEAQFAAIVDDLRDATDRKLEADPVSVVEVTQKRWNLNDIEKASVLTHLIQGGDLSQYGLMNAVTRSSQDVENYDRATALERFGGEIIELHPKDWKVISTGDTSKLRVAA